MLDGEWLWLLPSEVWLSLNASLEVWPTAFSTISTPSLITHILKWDNSSPALLHQFCHIIAIGGWIWSLLTIDHTRFDMTLFWHCGSWFSLVSFYILCWFFDVKIRRPTEHWAPILKAALREGIVMFLELFFQMLIGGNPLAYYFYVEPCQGEYGNYEHSYHCHHYYAYNGIGFC